MAKVRYLCFWKMHGAGNDFAIFVKHPAIKKNSIDSLTVKLLETKTNIIKLCHRNTGIGADGTILVLPSKKADFRVRFFNPDGSEASMCGNGARCAALLARMLGIAHKKMSMETADGIIEADSDVENYICLSLTIHPDYQLNIPIKVADRKFLCHFINTGVPHSIIEVKNLQKFQLMKYAPAIRYHKKFQPEGTNVDFIYIEHSKLIHIRTYERGVENETLACGTGVTAAGIAAGLLGKIFPPVKVKTCSGEVLEVNYSLKNQQVENITLKGKATLVYEGKMLSSFLHR